MLDNFSGCGGRNLAVCRKASVEIVQSIIMLIQAPLVEGKITILRGVEHPETIRVCNEFGHTLSQLIHALIAVLRAQV